MQTKCSFKYTSHVSSLSVLYLSITSSTCFLACESTSLTSCSMSLSLLPVILYSTHIEPYSAISALSLSSTTFLSCSHTSPDMQQGLLMNVSYSSALIASATFAISTSLFTDCAINSIASSLVILSHFPVAQLLP